MDAILKWKERVLQGCPAAVEKEVFAEFADRAYTKAWQVTREKREAVLRLLRLEEKELRGRELPYSISEYEGRVCGLLRELLADITGIDKEFFSVSYLYRPHLNGKQEWHQIKESGEAEQTLVRQIVEKEGSLFDRLLREGSLYLFVLDKKRSIRRKEYVADDRDAMFDNEGSALCMRVNLEDMGRKYVDGVLMISVYGKTFAEIDAYCRKYGKGFEHVLVYSILPYFSQLLQTESGLRYIRELTEAGK